MEIQNTSQKNLEEAVSQLSIVLSDSTKQEISSMTEEEFVGNAHLSLGMWIRNEWRLWKGGDLVDYFESMGIKNTSRKGMIFSDTKYSTHVNILNVIPLEDEKIGEYIITDGIGKISKDLMEFSTKIWGIDDSNLNIISAIQIRFMGCKGVFALDPSLDSNTVHYRESQKKFESDDTALNICSVSNYKEGFLNRKFIMLLSTLGEDKKNF
jgi:hypothetical protein